MRPSAASHRHTRCDRSGPLRGVAVAGAAVRTGVLMKVFFVTEIGAPSDCLRSAPRACMREINGSPVAVEGKRTDQIGMQRAAGAQAHIESPS